MNDRMTYVCAAAVAVAMVSPGTLGAGPASVHDTAQSALSSRLKADGWTQVKAGVFELRTGGTMRTVAFGPRGLAHARAQLQKHYAARVRANDGTADSVKALAAMQATLAALARPKDDAGINSDCNLDMSVRTNAYPHDGHGPVGYAFAHHSNSCSPGSVYAYSYSESRGVRQRRECDDAGWHNKVCERGTEAPPGNPPCFSEGYSYSWDHFSGIFQSSYSSNYECRQ